MLKKFLVVVLVWCFRVIIVSALSQRKRVERERERELDNSTLTKNRDILLINNSDLGFCSSFCGEQFPNLHVLGPSIHTYSYLWLLCIEIWLCYITFNPEWVAIFCIFSWYEQTRLKTWPCDQQSQPNLNSDTLVVYLEFQILKIRPLRSLLIGVKFPPTNKF